MKKLLLTSVFLFSGLSYAYEGFRCFPSFRETRLQILVVDDQVELLVVNPSGYQFMPQFASGSAFNLSFFKMQADDLKALGDTFIFRWPKDQCELDSKNLVVNCQGKALLPVETLNSFGISTTEILERYQNEITEKRRYRLIVQKENTYFVNLEFYRQNCEKFE